MPETIDYGAYWTEIRELAETVAKEARERGADVYDVLHETIDGHGWVIYTYSAEQVMHHTSSEDAMWEDGTPEAGSWSELVARAAYYAMRQDVTDALHELEEEEDGAAEPAPA